MISELTNTERALRGQRWQALARLETPKAAVCDFHDWAYGGEAVNPLAANLEDLVTDVLANLLHAKHRGLLTCLDGARATLQLQVYATSYNVAYAGDHFEALEERAQDHFEAELAEAV